MNIEKTAERFGIEIKIIKQIDAPQIKRYQVQPLGKTTVARIRSRIPDLSVAIGRKLSLTFDGQNLFIDEAREDREFVHAKITSSNELDVFLGLDLNRNRLRVDIGSLPHLLIAGTTGSGKSVLLKNIISQLMFSVDMVLIDPKIIELEQFVGPSNIQYESRPYDIYNALTKTKAEMMTRYSNFRLGGHITPLVIVIDEFAELILNKEFGSEIEKLVCSIAALGRAARVHLIVATQTPRVEVITGLIKANFPARIALSVATAIDSRVIIDAPGAENLLGKGDALLYSGSSITRFQAAMMPDKEIEKAVIKAMVKYGSEGEI